MKVTLSFPFSAGSLGFVHAMDDIHEQFLIARKLGFDGVDYVATLPDLYIKPQKIQALSVEFGMPIRSIHVPMHLLLFTPSFVQKPLFTMFQSFPNAAVLNFHLSGFITPLNKNGKAARDFIANAKRQSVPISFESNPLLKSLGKYPKVTYDPDMFAEFCIENHVPITFDTAHVAHCNYNIVSFFKKYHKYIKLIHLSDSIGRVQHLPLGKGNLPIKALLLEIKKKSYNGVLTFEICNFPASPTRKDKIKEIGKSFEMVKQYAI